MKPRCFRALIPLLLAGFLWPCFPPGQAADVSWKNPSDGNWTNAANWMPHAPLLGDHVFITNNGSYTVTVDSSLRISPIALTLGGMTGTQTLAQVAGTNFFSGNGSTNSIFILGGGGLWTSVSPAPAPLILAGVFVWTNGDFGGYGSDDVFKFFPGNTLMVSGEMRLSDTPNFKNMYGGLLVNQGLCLWTNSLADSRLAMYNSAIFSNAPGGIVDLGIPRSDAIPYQEFSGVPGSRPLLVNAGLLRKPVTTNFFPVRSITIGVLFQNYGTLEVQPGELRFSGQGGPFWQRSGQTFLNGAISANDPGIYLSGGTFVANGGSIPTGAVTNNAVLNFGASPHVLDIGELSGSYDQSGSQGTLQVKLGGTTTAGIDFDQLRVHGVATLGGTIEATFIAPYAPVLGDTFLVLTNRARNGVFSHFNYPSNLVDMALDYRSTGVVARIARLNFPPIIPPIPDQSATKYDFFVLQLAATDDVTPSQKLSWSLLAGPSGLTVSSSGLVEWFPGDGDVPGSKLVSVQVSDGNNATASRSFNVLLMESLAPQFIWSGASGSSGNWSDAANWGGVAPGNGATLVFPGGAPRLANTNNLANLRLHQIRFTGAGGGYNLFGNAVTLSNSLVTATSSGTNTINNDLALSADLPLVVGTNAGLVLAGALSGNASVSKQGSGTLTFSGNAPNTYSGTTFVKEGALLLGKSGPYDGAIPHDLVIGDELGAAKSDAVHLLLNNQIADSGKVIIQRSGLLKLNGAQEVVRTLDGGGYLALSNNINSILSINNDIPCVFDGPINGPGNLYINGPSIVTLNGTNQYTGETAVQGGTLIVNGYQANSTVFVLGGATLAGTGKVGQINNGGNLAPGGSPGVLTCNGNLTFSGGSSIFTVELNGPNAGTGYDQIQLLGVANLGGADLELVPHFSSPVKLGDVFAIIHSGISDFSQGTFAGLPANSTLNAGGFAFRIFYGLHDVSLTVTQVPAQTDGASLSGGNGNHGVDPNECNNLSIVITNLTPGPMTGVSAILSTTNAGVFISQPYSSYPNLPGNGKATNTTAFQISTLPAFVCGTAINLELTLTTASHGAFLVPAVINSGEASVTPRRFDVNVPTSIPDVGTAESTAIVPNFSGLLMKVAVSLRLAHGHDSDLAISLISPDGVVVDLSSGNGSGADFGTNCSPDSARTTFDDASAASILAASPPYLGTFRPEGSLASFIGGTANGTWRLRVTDSVGGTGGTLQCWSLFLYPRGCVSNDGPCASCFPPIMGSITNTDPVEVGHIAFDFIISSCGLPKTWPGTATGDSHYQLHSFSNPLASDVCVTAILTSDCPVEAVAYLSSFDRSHISVNYLGDTGAGAKSLGGTAAFSFSVPPLADFYIVVSEVFPDSGCSGYALSLSGLPCPPPLLNVQSVPNNRARISWSSSAGGYVLESTPSLTPANWRGVPNEPAINNGNYNVTNTIDAANKLYRLHKPY